MTNFSKLDLMEATIDRLIAEERQQSAQRVEEMRRLRQQVAQFRATTIRPVVLTDREVA